MLGYNGWRNVLHLNGGSVVRLDSCLAQKAPDILDMHVAECLGDQRHGPVGVALGRLCVEQCQDAAVSRVGFPFQDLRRWDTARADSGDDPPLRLTAAIRPWLDTRLNCVPKLQTISCDMGPLLTEAT